MEPCVPDFESVSQCDLKKAGAYRYWEDPTTEVLVLKYSFGDGPIHAWHPGEPVPQDIIDAVAAGVPFVAHNAEFEKQGWRQRMIPEYGFPPIPNSQWHCTMATAAMRALPQKLDKLAQVLQLPQQKDMEGNRLTIGLSKINKKTGMMPEITPAIQARVDDYCDGDIYTQRAALKRVGWLPPGEREVYLLNQRVNERGVGIDTALVSAMREVVATASKPLIAEFAQLTGGLAMTQIAKIHSWMLDQGVVLPDMKKETLESIVGSEDDDFEPDPQLASLRLPEPVMRALRIRYLIGSSSITKLPAMQACVMSDGRARGLLQYHGTMPGRQAGRLLQPHNFPRGTLLLDGEAPDPTPLVETLMTRDVELIEMLYGPAVETVVSSLRHCLIPGKGRVYCAGDLAGIQARTVLALAGQHDKAALMAAGADVYIDMACDIWPQLPRPDWKAPPDVVKGQVKAFKKAFAKERQTGKNSVLGLGFQMGAPKFLLKYCQDQGLEFAQTVVDAYRQKWAPEVPKVWRAVQDASLEAVKTGRPQEVYGCVYAREDDWLTLRLPSGRKLWYFNPQLTRRLMPWSTPEEPDVRLAWTYQTMKQQRWITVDAFGGLLTENIVMGIERDLMTNAAFLCEKNGFPVVLEVHDELVTEPEEKGLDEKALDQIMTDVPDWCKQMRIPVATEIWSGDRYRK